MTTGPVGVVLMAYGTPASRAAIEAYYTDIRRGRPPTAEQLADLTARYDAIGGLSPLAARTADQQAALQAALDGASAPAGNHGRFRVVLGLKHARPSIEDAAGAAVAEGCRRLVGLVLAPHFSAFSVGQYMNRLRVAGEAASVEVTGVDSWATEPALVEFLAAEVRRGLASLPAGVTVLFTAHSLPERILDSGDPYPDQLTATAAAVAEAAGVECSWEVAWQSAGRTPEPWLGPDILTVIDRLADDGAPGVLVCACGFVADHLEVLYDLDVEAARRASGRGLAFARTACVNADPAVMAALAHRVAALA